MPPNTKYRHLAPIVGVILLLVIIVVGVVSVYMLKRKDRFTYATPATPRVREGVTGVFECLTSLVNLGKQFEAEAGSLERHGSDLAPARRSVAALTCVLEKKNAELAGSPPTYANYLAIYRGLAGSDGAFLASADGYVAIGRKLHQEIALNPPWTPDGKLADVGNILMEIGRKMRLLTRRVHMLGVSLDLE